MIHAGKTRLKVLFYSHSSTVYGAPSSLINLVSGLMRNHADLEPMVVIPSKGPLQAELLRLNIPFRIIPHFRWTYNYSYFQAKRKQNILLAAMWLFKNYSSRHLRNMLQLVRHINFCRQFDPDIIYVNSCTAPMGLFVGLIRNVKVICHQRETLNDPVTGFFLDFGKHFANRFLSKAALHIFPSLFLRDSYRWVTPMARLLVQYNGVYFKDEIKPVRPRATLEKRWKFAMVGRISEQKGQEEVVNCFVALAKPNFQLHIYGSGIEEYVDRLRKLSKNSSVTFMGFTDRDTIYTDTHFVIINARNESFGRVVAEANAYGIPVLALASGALSEIVINGVNGYQYSDFKELRSFIISVEGFQEKYAALQMSSRKHFEKEFSIESYADRIYTELSKKSATISST